MIPGQLQHDLPVSPRPGERLGLSPSHTGKSPATESRVTGSPSLVGTDD